MRPVERLDQIIISCCVAYLPTYVAPGDISIIHNSIILSNSGKKKLHDCFPMVLASHEICSNMLSADHPPRNCQGHVCCSPYIGCDGVHITLHLILGLHTYVGTFHRNSRGHEMDGGSSTLLLQPPSSWTRLRTHEDPMCQ